MTEYIYRAELIAPNERIEIPDNARDVSIEYRELNSRPVARVSYLEKKKSSVL